MSLHDATERLIRCLEATTSHLQRLQDAMSTRRQAWVAIRPSEMEQSVSELETIAAECADLAHRRVEILEQIATHLGRPESQGLRITTIAARLPRTLAMRLRRAADAAARGAMSLRAEGALGQKLLEFSQRSQESMFRTMLAPPADAPRGYDRNARLVSGHLGDRPAAGSILDGKL